MKWFLVFSLLFLASCAPQTTALISENSSNLNISANQTAVNTNVSTTSDSEHNKRRGKLSAQNERFKIVPEEFKNVDFKNFTYPTKHPQKSVKLKEGKFEYFELEDENGWFAFDDAFFVDLTGDNVKEALVLLFQVNCGVSCDGGSYLIYVYGAKQSKPKLIWQIELGGMAYDCGLKSLTVRERKVLFDVFAQCVEKNGQLKTGANYTGASKGFSYGTTEFIYKFDGRKFVREKTQYTASEKIDHLNYLPEISIND